MNISHVTKENFRKEVLESDKTVLVDFWANWCGPCRMIAPILEEIAAERPDVKICKVDVDQEPELAASFNVMSIPMLLVFKDGDIVDQAIGARPKPQILGLLG